MDPIYECYINAIINERIKSSDEKSLIYYKNGKTYVQHDFIKRIKNQSNPLFFKPTEKDFKKGQSVYALVYGKGSTDRYLVKAKITKTGYYKERDMNSWPLDRYTEVYYVEYKTEEGSVYKGSSTSWTVPKIFNVKDVDDAIKEYEEKEGANLFISNYDRNIPTKFAKSYSTETRKFDYKGTIWELNVSVNSDKQLVEFRVWAKPEGGGVVRDGSMTEIRYLIINDKDVRRYVGAFKIPKLSDFIRMRKGVSKITKAEMKAEIKSIYKLAKSKDEISFYQYLKK